MAVRILHDMRMDRACLYDTTTEQPLGYGFVGENSGDQAEAFLIWLDGEDPRCLDWQQFSLLHAKFLSELRAAPDPARWLEKLLFEDDDDTEHEAADIAAELAK